MNDADKKDKEGFRENLRKEFGFTEEQLLKEMEEAETASVDDSMFEGVEDRMFQKLMERKADEEKKDMQEKGAEKAEGAETKKVVRFGKKKAILSAVLVAAFALALGTTAIGGKSYFFRSREKNEGVVLNNTQYIENISNLEDAYKTIKEKLKIIPLKLGYIPMEMEFENLAIGDFNAVIQFNYQNRKVYFIQEVQRKDTSFYSNFDLEKATPIYNSWLKQNVDMTGLEVESGIEYKAQIHHENGYYTLIGIIPEDEMKKMITNFNFY